MLRLFLIVAILFETIAAPEAAEESLGTKIKKFLGPTPTPTPSRKHRKRSTGKSTPSPSPTASPKKKISPAPSASPTPETKSKRKKRSPTPSAYPSSTTTPEGTATPIPSETPQPTAPPSATAHPTPEKKGGPNATISPREISGYDNYPRQVRQIIEHGLDLTKQNINYTYGSADPANGGMDCSGFCYYVLRQNEFNDVPRGSSQQYV